MPLRENPPEIPPSASAIALSARPLTLARACVRSPCLSLSSSQARRLESQLYQRAQDQRTIEVAQRQAALARQQMRQLEQHHLEQAARISQSAKSLQRLQELMRESISSNEAALGLCEALEHDAAALKRTCDAECPDAAARLTLRGKAGEAVAQLAALKSRAQALEASLAETERSAMQQIGVTPLTSVAMSSDCNPLNDLSAVADYATKANVGAGRPAAEVQQQAAPPSAAPSNVPPGMVQPMVAHQQQPMQAGLAGSLQPLQAPTANPMAASCAHGCGHACCGMGAMAPQPQQHMCASSIPMQQMGGAMAGGHTMLNGVGGGAMAGGGVPPPGQQMLPPRLASHSHAMYMRGPAGSQPPTSG